VLSNIWVFTIDVERVLIDLLSFFLIIICISDLTLFTHSERVFKSSFSRFVNCLVKSSTGSTKILKLCFQLMDLGSRYLGPFANTSRREVLLIILKSPVITCPVGLYMNGENCTGPNQEA